MFHTRPIVEFKNDELTFKTVNDRLAVLHKAFSSAVFSGKLITGTPHSRCETMNMVGVGTGSQTAYDCLRRKMRWDKKAWTRKL